MRELTPIERRALRAAAHHLNPVVSIAGNGLTPNVLKEIDTALKAHELIKIRVYGDDRDQRQQWLTEICDTLDCAPVQLIGKLLVVYREKPEAETPAKPVAKRPQRASARPGAASPRARARTGSGSYTPRSTPRARSQSGRGAGSPSRRGGKPRP